MQGFFIIHNSCYCNLLFLRFSAISAVSLKKLRVLRVIRWQRFTDETTVRIEIKVNINSKSWLNQLQLLNLQRQNQSVTNHIRYVL